MPRPGAGLLHLAPGRLPQSDNAQYVQRADELSEVALLVLILGRWREISG